MAKILPILILSIILLGAGCTGYYECGDTKVTKIRYQCADGLSGCTKIFELDNGSEVLEHNRMKQTPDGYLCIWKNDNE